MSKVMKVSLVTLGAYGFLLIGLIAAGANIGPIEIVLFPTLVAIAVYLCTMLAKTAIAVVRGLRGA